MLVQPDSLLNQALEVISSSYGYRDAELCHLNEAYCVVFEKLFDEAVKPEVIQDQLLTTIRDSGALDKHNKLRKRDATLFPIAPHLDPRFTKRIFRYMRDTWRSMPRYQEFSNAREINGVLCWIYPISAEKIQQWANSLSDLEIKEAYFIAKKRGQINILRALESHKRFSEADPESCSFSDVLISAAGGGRDNVVKALMNDEEFESSTIPFSETNETNEARAFSAFSRAFMHAGDAGHINVIDLMLQNSFSPRIRCDILGYVFKRACLYGRSDIVRAFLSDDRFRTAIQSGHYIEGVLSWGFQHAARNGLFNIVRLILELGYIPQINYSVAFSRAVRYGQREVVLQIIQSRLFNYVEVHNNGYQPGLINALELAADLNREAIVLDILRSRRACEISINHLLRIARLRSVDSDTFWLLITYIANRLSA